jgi:hypothetical protein
MFEDNLPVVAEETFAPLYEPQLESEGKFIQMGFAREDMEDAIGIAKSYVHKGRTRVIKYERSIEASFEQSGEEDPDDRWS